MHQSQHPVRARLLRIVGPALLLFATAAVVGWLPGFAQAATTTTVPSGRREAS